MTPVTQSQHVAMTKEFFILAHSHCIDAAFLKVLSFWKLLQFHSAALQATSELVFLFGLAGISCHWLTLALVLL